MVGCRAHRFHSPPTGGERKSRRRHCGRVLAALLCIWSRRRRRCCCCYICPRRWCCCIFSRYCSAAFVFYFALALLPTSAAGVVLRGFTTIYIYIYIYISPSVSLSVCLCYPLFPTLTASVSRYVSNFESSISDFVNVSG